VFEERLGSLSEVRLPMPNGGGDEAKVVFAKV
jgi:hypothetical protein